VDGYVFSPPFLVTLFMFFNKSASFLITRNQPS
jgi:hypothetical protein